MIFVRVGRPTLNQFSVDTPAGLKTGQFHFQTGLMLRFYMMLSGGAPSARNPNSRNPPMKHAEFKMKVRDAEKNPTCEWSKPETHAMDLINRATSQDPETRGRN